MITCLLEGMKKAIIKPVNYKKFREVTQEPSENLALFQAQLVEAMRKYTSLDPETPDGQAILAVHFVSQASPCIRQKLQKLEQGPQTPFSVLLDMAFKVFNNREEASRNRRELREEEKLKRHAQYTALAITQPLPQRAPTGAPLPSQKPPLTCYQCSQQGHTVRNCHTPPPDTPCPYRHQKGHLEEEFSLPPSSG